MIQKTDNDSIYKKKSKKNRKKNIFLFKTLFYQIH